MRGVVKDDEGEERVCLASLCVLGEDMKCTVR